MGFLKGAAKLTGKAFKGIGGATISAGKGVGGLAFNQTKSALSKRGMMVAAGSAGAGLIGAGLAAADGEASITGTATKGAIAGAGAGIMSGTAATGLAMAGTGALSASAIGAGAMYSLGNKMISTPSKMTLSNTHEIKATGIGKMALFAGGMAEGAIRAKDEFYKSRMGQHDGMSRGPTPTIPRDLTGNGQSQPFNNAGADGDLVFALNNLRQGR